MYVESLRTFHLSTARELNIGNDTIAELEVLLDELKVRHITNKDYQTKTIRGSDWRAFRSGIG